MKTCSWCKAPKKLSSFNRSASAKDGHQSQCKLCNREFRKQWMRNDPDRTHSYDKLRNNTIEVNARAQLRNAVRNGTLVKPKTCSGCGKKKPVTGHHDDYAKPLKVRWVCRTCHEDIHFEMRHQ